MKVLFWVLFAIGCVYAFYGAAMSLWSYLEIKGVVEEVVAERASRGDRQERAARVQEDVAKRVAASGIKVGERGIAVSDEGRTLDIRVQWTWPVIAYQGEEYLAIPLWHERVFDVPDRR